MAKKPDKTKKDDPEQSERFVKAAQKFGAVDDESAFEEVLASIKPKAGHSRPSGKQSSS